MAKDRIYRANGLNNTEIRQYNDWYDHIGSLTQAEREKWAKSVIDDLKERVKKEKNKKIAQLIELLEDKSKCKIVGFHPYIEYMRVRGDKEALEPNYLHAWGGISLVCVIKDLPCVMIVNADMEWTDHEGFKG